MSAHDADKLAPALIKAQGMIKTAAKDSVNPHFKSRYSDLGAVWDAVKDALQANDLAVVQCPIHSDDNRVHLRTTLVHASGQYMETCASIPIAKQDAHGYGSGLTYLRRYSLASMLGVVSDDDDGNAAVEKPKAQKFGSNGAEVNSIEFNAMNEEEQLSMRLHASIVTGEKDAKKAAAYIVDQGFTHEEIMALWSLLSSSTRAALKKAKEAPAKSPALTELEQRYAHGPASQP